jgi:hypothetical protein
MNPIPLPHRRKFFVSSKPQPYVIAFNLSSGTALDGGNSFRVAFQHSQPDDFLRRRNNRPSSQTSLGKRSGHDQRIVLSLGMSIAVFQANGHYRQNLLFVNTPYKKISA